MTCERAREHIVDSLTGRLDDSVQFEFRAHLNGCAACQAELDAASATWAQLGDIPTEEPSHAMHDRFYRMLEAYQHGAGARSSSRFSWSRNSFWQVAALAAAMAIGAGIGAVAASQGEKNAEVAQLREEVTSMRQLVTLSMLQQQSAADRLQGVNWSYRVPQSDTEVLSALLRTVNTDSNENVRLAAADALRSFAGSPVARRGMEQSLLKQTSPLMQIVLIDLLVEMQQKSAAESIRTLLDQSDLDPNVRKRAHWALDRLQ